MKRLNVLPSLDIWRAEGLRLRRLPLARVTLGVLLTVLIAVSTAAGLEARAWRQAATEDEIRLAAARQAARPVPREAARTGRRASHLPARTR